MSIKYCTVSTTLHMLAKDALSDLARVGAECLRAGVSMPKNIQGSSRPKILISIGKTLSVIPVLQIPDSAGDTGVVVRLMYETRRRGPTRYMQRDFAVERLRRASALLDDWASKNEKHDDYVSVIDVAAAILDIVDVAVRLTFPGPIRGIGYD